MAATAAAATAVAEAVAAAGTTSPNGSSRPAAAGHATTGAVFASGADGRADHLIAWQSKRLKGSP